MGSRAGQAEKQQERRRQAWALRIQGLSQTEIADRLGVQQQTISDDLRLAHPEYIVMDPKAREQFVKWYVARTEWMFTCLVPKIKDGDLKAIKTALDILDNEARLFGTGVIIPHSLDISVNTSNPDEMRAKLMAALEERSNDGRTNPPTSTPE